MPLTRRRMTLPRPHPNGGPTTPSTQEQPPRLTPRREGTLPSRSPVGRLMDCLMNATTRSTTHRAGPTRDNRKLPARKHYPAPASTNRHRLDGLITRRSEVCAVPIRRQPRTDSLGGRGRQAARHLADPGLVWADQPASTLQRRPPPIESRALATRDRSDAEPPAPEFKCGALA